MHNKGKKLSEIYTITKIKEMSTSASVSVARDDGDRMSNALNSLGQLSKLLQVFELGYESRITEEGFGTWIVDGKYYFFPKTGKWRSVGKSKLYRSKGIQHFIETYVDKK